MDCLRRQYFLNRPEVYATSAHTVWIKTLERHLIFFSERPHDFAGKHFIDLIIWKTAPASPSDEPLSPPATRPESTDPETRSDSRDIFRQPLASM